MLTKNGKKGKSTKLGESGTLTNFLLAGLRTQTTTDALVIGRSNDIILLFLWEGD